MLALLVWTTSYFCILLESTTKSTPTTNFNQSSMSFRCVTKLFLQRQKNLKLIATLNDMEQSESYGITKFIDLSQEEFAQRHLMTYFKSDKDKEFFEMHIKTPIPSQFDWNSVGKVTSGNQSNIV